MPDVGATLAVALSDMPNTQPCIPNTEMRMKITQSYMKDKEVGIKYPLVCIKDTQPCMPNIRLGIWNTRLWIKYPR